MSDLFNYKNKTSTLASTMKNVGTKVEKDSSRTMSQETFELMRETVYKLSGIYYTDQKKYLLESRISKRLAENNIKTFEEYHKLINSINGRSELNQLFEAITINETFFFRADHQFNALEKILIPEILEKKNLTGDKFRIWSAASSTGEEAYTIAIIINEIFKPRYPNIQFEIIASDINNKVLQQARQATYKDYAVRNMPDSLKNKYFTKDGNLWQLDNSIRSMVKFMNINLYDSMKMRAMTSFDIIFCCNVLIYFDLNSKQKVVGHLYDSLNEGGYLFIGYSESLHGVSKAFSLVHLPKAMAYKK